MILDLNQLKTNTMNSLRTYLYPRQTSVSSSISLYTEGTINQAFYPFSTSFSTGLVYLSSKVGTPGPVTIDILSKSNTITSSTVSLSTGWNTLSLNQGDIVSRNIHTLSVHGGVDASNDYKLGTGSSISYFYGTLSTGGILAFSIGVNDFVFKEYPMSSTMKMNSLPLIAIDITSRPSVRDKYISGDMMIEDIEVNMEVYSRYTDEVDRLCYGIERGLVLNRKNFGTDIFKVSPVILRPLSFISPEIFFREVSFYYRIFISRE
jgi:hypothetical protein